MSEPGSPSNEGDDDFTAAIPMEVLVHVLRMGNFTPSSLAPLRLVNRALSTAASDPSLYRVACVETSAHARLETIPAFVRGGLRRLKLSFHGVAEPLDLTAFRQDRYPNLTSLAVGGTTLAALDGLPQTLRELWLQVGPNQDLQPLGKLTRLECLALADVESEVPLASLPLLRRLSLTSVGADGGALLESLAASPSAPGLQALCLGFNAAPSVRPDWWAPLSCLENLKEFGLDSMRPSYMFSGDQADPFAALLCRTTTLEVLSLGVDWAVASAVTRHGLPASLRVVRFEVDTDEPLLALLVPLLPAGLTALQVFVTSEASSSDLGSLLSRCPALTAIALVLEPDLAAELAAFDSVAPLMVGDPYRAFTDEDREKLEAAGHRVGHLIVGVQWRQAGGVAFYEVSLGE